MNIGKIVERHADNLKLEVGTALNLDECFDLINNAVKEATELKSDLLNRVVDSITDSDLHRQIHSAFNWAVENGAVHYGDETDERMFNIYYGTAFTRMM